MLSLIYREIMLYDLPYSSCGIYTGQSGMGILHLVDQKYHFQALPLPIPLNGKAVHPSELSLLAITGPFWSTLIPTERDNSTWNWVGNDTPMPSLKWTRLIHNDRWERHKKLKHGLRFGLLPWTITSSAALKRWQCWSPGCENHLLV